MNPLRLLSYAFIRDKDALQSQVKHDIEEDLRKAGARNDPAGNLIIDQGTVARLQQNQRRPFDLMALLISTIFLFAGVLLVNWLLTDYRNSELLSQNGATASGIVLRKYQNQTVSDKNRITYWITYSFDTPEGRHVTQDVKVGKTSFGTLQEGGPVLIDYVRTNPSLAYLKTGKHPGQDLPIGIIFTSVWILGAGALWISSLLNLLKR
jgi:hypothetical protein